MLRCIYFNTAIILTIHRADVLIDKVYVQWLIPSFSQVIFSASSSHCISPHGNILQPQLVELLDRAGASEGHAKLYLLPLSQLQQEDVTPDSTCFTALSKFPLVMAQFHFIFILKSILWKMKYPLSILLLRYVINLTFILLFS